MDNKIVNEAIDAAKDIDKEVRGALFGDLTNEDFVAIDTEYPEMLTTDKAPLPKEECVARHLAFVDRISKLSVTHSLFLGLGFEVPTGHALSEAAVSKYLEAVKAQVTVVAHDDTEEPYYEFIVLHPSSEYKFLDTDHWLGGLRALHFLATHYDPDLTEYISRKLAQSGGLDAEWAKSLAVK